MLRNKTIYREASKIYEALLRIENRIKKLALKNKLVDIDYEDHIYQLFYKLDSLSGFNLELEGELVDFEEIENNKGREV